MQIPDGIMKSILHPDREVTVQLPVSMDNNEVCVCVFVCVCVC